MLHEERRGIVRTDRMEDKEGRSCDTARTLACGVIDFDTSKAVVENFNATSDACKQGIFGQCSHSLAIMRDKF